MAGFVQNMRNAFSGTPAPQQRQQPQGQQQQQQQPNQHPSAGQQQQQGQGMNTQFNNGAPAGDPNNPARQQQQPTNPLDDLTSIWTGPQNGQPQNSNQGGAGQQQQGQQGQQQQQQQQQQPEYRGFTAPWNADGLRQRVGSIDFLRGVPQETMQRLSSGDMTALPDIINHAVRESYMASAQTTHGMLDRGIQTGLDRFGTGLDDRFRDYEIRRQTPANDVMAHPAVAPVFSMLKSQVAQQFPHLSPEQVSAQAQQWFDGLYGAMNGKQQAAAQSNAPKQQDWSASFANELGMDSDDNFIPQGF